MEQSVLNESTLGVNRRRVYLESFNEKVAEYGQCMLVGWLVSSGCVV